MQRSLLLVLLKLVNNRQIKLWYLRLASFDDQLTQWTDIRSTCTTIYEHLFLFTTCFCVTIHCHQYQAQLGDGRSPSSHGRWEACEALLTRLTQLSEDSSVSLMVDYQQSVVVTVHYTP